MDQKGSLTSGFIRGCYPTVAAPYARAYIIDERLQTLGWLRLSHAGACRRYARPAVAGDRTLTRVPDPR